MPRPGLPIPRLPRTLALVLCASLSANLCAAPVAARNPKPPKYPLHVHVLAADESHKSPRMSPGDAAACDAIDDMLSSISPNPGGPISLTGLSGDPCSLHPEMVTGRLLDLGDDAPVFSGAGRADLVTPPAGTQGFNFHYDDCSRIRVRPGFQSLAARWKQPGKKLEVLVPSDEIPVNGRPLKPVKCTFAVTMHDYVYLLLRNGNVTQVSQEVYWRRPALRVFLTGMAQTMQPRTPPQFTISAHPAATAKPADATQPKN